MTDLVIYLEIVGISLIGVAIIFGQLMVRAIKKSAPNDKAQKEST